MKIVVCMKQVPATSKVDIDPETGAMKRMSGETRTNPYDLFALETALAIREKTGGKHLWLRNNLATITTQLFDSAMFTLLAFVGIHSFKTVVVLIFSTYAVKVMIAAADTPFLYIARKIRPLTNDLPDAASKK